jgi:hypothetical protein
MNKMAACRIGYAVEATMNSSVARGNGVVGDMISVELAESGFFARIKRS